MRRPDPNGRLTTACTLHSCEESWVAPTELCVTLDEPATLLYFEGNDRFDDVPLPNTEMEDPLAVDVNAKNDWDLWDILHSGEIDVWSRFVLQFFARPREVSFLQIRLAC